MARPTPKGTTVANRALPSAGFSMTIRVAVPADASAIGRLTTCVGEAGAVVAPQQSESEPLPRRFSLV